MLFEKTTLNNGLRLITHAMPHTRSVSICIFLAVGSRYETGAEAGISHFIEHLCFKGTPKRATPKDIAAAIEGVGGILNAAADRELTLYWCKVAQPHFLLALDVLADILLNSKLDPADIERERQVIIEEIHAIKDSPYQRVSMLTDELLWPDHPLGRDVAGNEESVLSITQDMITGFLAGRYLPASTVVAIAGDIQHEGVVGAVNEAFGGWSGQQPAGGYLAHEERPNPRLGMEVRDTEQTHLCLALPGLPLLHPKRYALDLLNTILGEGMSSRLFVEIRDNLGLAYSIHSYVEHLHDTGAMIIYAGVEHEKLPVAIKAILEQLASLYKPVSNSELTKVKELSKGRLLLRMEDSRSVAGWAGGQEILTNRILSVDQVVSIIDAITAEQVVEVAQELIVEDRLRLAVVGPVKDGDELKGLLRL
ncbi:MAG: insulinase family protein [Dehalococcoidales bacterium]|nr:MAG: insulinase family protein [Dehalococcoidales bacterium]